MMSDSAASSGAEGLVPVILLTNTTWWPCASRLALALSKAGCRIAALYPTNGHPLAKTSVVRQRFSYSALHPLRSLTAAIEAANPDLVIPCDDRAVQHLHELYAHGAKGPATSPRGKITSLIERSLGSSSSHPIVSSRSALLSIAQEEGILIPGSNRVRTQDDLHSWQTGHPFPWVLKAEGTWGGHGVRIAHSFEEARRFLAEMTQPLTAIRAVKRLLVDRDPFWLRSWWSRSLPRVVVQSQIQGRPANCAVFCWKGKVLAGIVVDVISAQGTLGSAAVVRVVDNAEMSQAAEILAARLGLSGFFGLDFMIEEKSGAAYLIEMNPRCTPLCHLQLGDGRDMIGALYQQLSGELLPPLPPVTRDSMIAYYPQAWHWNPESEFLRSAFHDVPWEQPELVHELRKLPWPDRSLLARLSNRLRHTTFVERAARGGEFRAAVPPAPPVTRTNSPGLANPCCPPSVIPLRGPGAFQPAGPEPLFLIHGVDGHVVHFWRLVRDLNLDLPIYGIQSQALLREKVAQTRVEELAAYYLKEVRALHPNGPIHLLGFSFGGLIAFEMARQLHAQGEQTGLVGMVDNLRMGTPATLPGSTRLKKPAGRLSFHLKRLFGSDGYRYATDKLRARSMRTIYTLLDAIGQPIPRFLQSAYDVNWFAAVRYVPQFFPGKLTLFQTAESLHGGASLHSEWARLAGEGIEIREIPGKHTGVLSGPTTKLLAREITDCLSGIDRTVTSKRHT